MAIQNLKTIRRFQDLAKTGDLTDVTSYNFRSLEEIKEYVNQVMKSAQDDIKDINDFKKLFEPAAFRKLQMDYIVAAIKLKQSKKVVKAPAKPAIVKPLKGITTITQDSNAPVRTPKAKVKEGEAIPVEFVGIEGKDLEKKFKAMDSLSTKIKSLDGLLVKIAYEHHDDPKMTGEITRYIKTKREALQKELVAAYAFLETTAKKTEPKQFKLPVKHIIEKVTETFKDSFDSTTQYVYVTPKAVVDAGKKNVLFVYNHYLEIKNFKMDNGDVYPKYFIVFTGIVNPVTKKMEMFFSTFTTYPQPGSFKPVHEFTKESNGLRDLYIALDQENFSTFIERVPLEVTGPQLKKMKWNVPKGMIRSVTTELNIITFSLDPKLSKEAALNVRDVLSADLILQAVSENKNSLAIRGPYKPAGSNVWLIDFVFKRASHQFLKKIRVTHDQIDYFSNTWGLTRQKAADLVRNLNVALEDIEDPDAEEEKQEKQGKPAIKTIQSLPTVDPKKTTKGILRDAMKEVLDELNTRYKLDSNDNTVSIDEDFHFEKNAIKSLVSKALKGSRFKLERVRSLPNDLALFLTDTKAHTGFTSLVVSFEPRKNMKMV